jgi:hypothetical protein
MMILQNYTMHKKQKPEFNPNNITTNRHIYGPRCGSTRTSKSSTGCEPMKLKVEQKKKIMHALQIHRENHQRNPTCRSA